MVLSHSPKSCDPVVKRNMGVRDQTRISASPEKQHGCPFLVWPKYCFKVRKDSGRCLRSTTRCGSYAVRQTVDQLFRNRRIGGGGGGGEE